MYIPGKSKEYIRDNVFLYFINCTHILTLPNLHFYLEKLCIKDGKTVECVERDLAIYNQQKLINPGVKLHHSNLSDLNLSIYDGLFLDMCGPFTIYLSKSLMDIKSGARVVITLLLARESKLLQGSINLVNREESYVELLAEHDIIVDKYINYNDGSPMCVFFGYKL